jgi:hypothetical protein
MANSLESITAFFTDAPAGVLAELNEIDERMAGLGAKLNPALDEIDAALMATLTDDELRQIISWADAGDEVTR